MHGMVERCYDGGEGQVLTERMGIEDERRKVMKIICFCRGLNRRRNFKLCQVFLTVWCYLLFSCGVVEGEAGTNAKEVEGH